MLFEGDGKSGGMGLLWNLSKQSTSETHVVILRR